MKNRIFLAAFAFAFSILVAACGTEAVSRPDLENTRAAGTAIAAGLITPSNTPESTNTSVPATATDVPTEIPTEVPTEAPTEIPTEEPTEVPLVVANPTGVPSGDTPSEDVIAANVEIADATRGQLIFSANAIPTCSSCHFADQETNLVGPGLLNFRDHAGDRVEGEGPYTYAYNSIRYSQVFVVDGYPAGVMPAYDGVLNDEDVYDIIAYLWTLHD